MNKFLASGYPSLEKNLFSSGGSDTVTNVCMYVIDNVRLKSKGEKNDQTNFRAKRGPKQNSRYLILIHLEGDLADANK